MKPLKLPVEPGAVSPYWDPTAYTEQNAGRRDDIAYYVGACRRARGPVLECGCGNGRITLPLARAGVHVTGVDLSPAMLDDFGARLEREPPDVKKRVSVRRQDMRQLSLGRRFARVIAPYDTFSHLYNRSDVEAFLAGVRRHLVPRGRLIFDVALTCAAELLGPGLDYDAMAQVSRRRLPGSRTSELSLRHYHSEELSVLLRNNGFTQIRLTADHLARALSAGAHTLVVSAMPRPC